MIIVTGSSTIDYAPDHGAYIPWITPLPNGCFIAGQHVGSGLGANNCRIEIPGSPDGRQWNNEGIIADQCSSYSYRMPQKHALPDGRLLMTATRFACSDVQLFDTESEALQQPQILPVELPTDRYNANGADMLLQLRHSRWMYPFETWKPEGYCGPPDQKAGALFSSNDGQTWDE